MAKKIILLERTRREDAVDLKVVLWIDVPPGNQVAQPDMRSSYRDAADPELAALRAGAVREVARSFSWPQGTPVAQIRQDLIDEYQRVQTQTNSVNPREFYGAYWDGSSWHLA